MLIERFPTPNSVPGREGHAPEGIVLHTAEGSFESVTAWFAKASSRVSAHYLVGLDGRVAQFVEEADTARHAGRKVRAVAALARKTNPNLTTIGIEFEDGGNPSGIPRTDVQYAAGASLIAGIARRWRVPLDREHVIAHREINASKTCPGNLDVDRLLAEARVAAARPSIVCLLPVRNGEDELPAWLAAAPSWCDAVIALDDGSTDRTRELLEGSPIVATVLENPQRETFRGWHDGRNRNRLLEAAAALSPEWILSVDADERISAEDAAAMREFLATDGVPAVAYGFRHVRMWGRDRFDPREMWVYRLFAFEPGLRFPDQPLHFNPVPISIPRNAWVRTTLRMLHFGAADEKLMRARFAKYREADPDGGHPTGFGGLDDVPSTTDVLRRRDPAHHVLAPTADQLGLRPIFDDAGGRPLITVLVPVRNGETDLPGWFESVERFADAVVALDDGSTDGTRAILESHPLVKRVLKNPARASSAGWDDAANRNALLEAASELHPRWILSLDADERIGAEDAEALRGFVGAEAEPGTAYGFRVFRMIGDEKHWDRADLLAYRLFAYEPEQRFPDDRLHFVPIPSSIPRHRFVATTVRIKHLASLTEERRRARFEKYRQADPRGDFQAVGYQHLLDRPGEVEAWEPRPANLPVVAEDALAAEDLDLTAPVLSAIVIAHDDEARIERSLRSVVEQECDEPFEVIVVTSGSDRTAAIVRRMFPQVTVVELDRPALPGQARNAGLAVARGDYVSFPGSHVVLALGSLAARIRAHELGYPMVTGTTLNSTDTPAGWASYFLDHSSVLPGRPSEELSGPPAHCSYDRGLLERVGGFPGDFRTGEDTVVNLKLATIGCRAYRTSDAVLYHESPCRTAGQLLSHHFRRGRGLGRILLGRVGPKEPALPPELLRRTGPLYVPRRLRGTRRNVERWGTDEMRSTFRRVRPLVAAGALASWLGTWFELLLPERGKIRRLFG